MKILHLNMLYPPFLLGGAERSVSMLAEAQATAGHEVAIACTTPNAFEEEVLNGVRVFRMPHGTRFWAEEWPNHSGIERFWRKLTLPLNRTQRHWFGKILDTVRPDLVHSHSMVDVSTGLWTLARKRGYPLVHTLRDYDLLCADSAMYHHGRGCGAKCKIVSAGKHRQHRAIAAVAANSAETLRIHLERGLFSHLHPDNRRVIWNVSGVSLPPHGSERAPREGPFTFGYLGRINAEKGVRTLIDAARLLSGAPFRVLIAGKQSRETEPFRAAAKDLPVEFLGFVEPVSFLKCIDVLVIPSIWAEPLPRTALEAYANGVPVLGSRAGGTPDVIGQNNDDWLFEPGDPDDLAAKMAARLAAGRRELPSIDQFRPLLEETTPDVVVRKYDDLYASLLNA
ncbi:glycosyltransferase family 4 protein [Sphingomonas sp. LY29]|uniref:glycosyltransferase family 4 protein n=1 Tax=Sphingomonas sp. LY29 TaxID=3095341 RepID=UPI002D79094A|nr:glycosyltransferase family 4 protein [Sphingomonas sp. LY29]WRP26338.1 glycosyltransferase family 4 protein [Sphingomonas sp. LY29]